MSTSSAQLAADLSQLHTDAGLLHTVIHGDSGTVVATLGGPVRSVANAINSITQFTLRGAWATSTAYAFKDLFTDSGTAYLALVDHVSSTIAADLAAGKIGVYQGAMLADLENTTDPTKGASLIGFKQSGSGSVGRTLAQRAADMLSVADKGTPADVAAALGNIAADLTNGGLAYLPRGTWTLPSTFAFTGQRLRIEGEGQNSSMLVYSPAATGAALNFDAGNSNTGGIYQGRVSGVGFSSDAANAQIKTAINLVNCSDFEVSRIGIAGGSWPGDSIGVRTYGRQTLSMHHCEISCARPLVFSKNPVWPSLNTDHYDIYRCELSGESATRPVIEFEDGVAMSTTTLRNLAITGGKDGILWSDTTSSAASFGLAIDTVRFEQGRDPTGYSINLGSTAQTLQMLAIRDVTLDSLRNGIKLRNVQRVIIENVAANMTSGVALDMTFVPGSRLSLRNFFQQTGSSITLTNAKCIQRDTNAANVVNEEWIYDDGANAGAQQSAVPWGGVPFSLAAGADVKIAANTFVGHVDVMTSSGVAATFMLAGTNGVAFKIADGSGQFSSAQGTGSSNNVYYDAATATYRLQNTTGASRNYAVLYRGNGGL